MTGLKRRPYFLRTDLHREQNTAVWERKPPYALAKHSIGTPTMAHRLLAFSFARPDLLCLISAALRFPGKPFVSTAISADFAHRLIDKAPGLLVRRVTARVVAIRGNRRLDSDREVRITCFRLYLYSGGVWFPCRRVPAFGSVDRPAVNRLRLRRPARLGARLSGDFRQTRTSQEHAHRRSRPGGQQDRPRTQRKLTAGHQPHRLRG